MIHEQRLSRLNDGDPDPDGRYVLYWMQQSQRAELNPALEFAARQANELDKPLVVGFGLDPDYPEANERHYAFMLQGLAETKRTLAERGIKLVMRPGSPPEVAAALAREAAFVVCDRGYLRHQRGWRRKLCDAVEVPVVEVEGDVVVPVEVASDKAEHAARTIRRKLNDRIEEYAKSVSPVKLGKSSLPLDLKSKIDIDDWRGTLDELGVDASVPPVERFTGGTGEARRRLARFLRGGLPGYADARNDPADPQASELSPYLHFGQISPVEILLKVRRARGAGKDDKTAFLEELVIRRELACNFTWFTPDYDSWDCLPDWARKTLAEHADDLRSPQYTRAELEAADTDDTYWNAAMQEMLKTGYMHNYMRMYWGKKILEWSSSPEYAYRTTLYLNNKYFLDGRDPNSYANVGWVFGLHDRGWTERDVFGKVRYMNARGLERKFDIEAYVERVGKMPDPGD